MPITRWLLVLPLGVAGVFAGFAVAIALVSLAERVCPAEMLVSGMCIAPWYRFAETGAYCVGAVVGAACAVALPFLAAPSHKQGVALVALALGTAFAAWFLFGAGTSVALPFACAVGSGLLTARKALRRNASAA
jgi:hypothetical protein